MNSITDSVSATRPSADEQYHHTVKDLRWALDRFTDSSWGVETVEIEWNDHCAAKANVPEAILQHESDSLIQVSAIDPIKHFRKRPIYQRNRVRVRNTESGDCYYVTVPNEASTDDVVPFDELNGREEHPYPDADARLEFHQQTGVHSADERAFDQNRRRACHFEQEEAVLIAVLGAAQWINSTVSVQRGLTDF